MAKQNAPLLRLIMKILYLRTVDKNLKHINDFLHDALLIGLRNKFGEDVIDFPGTTYMYRDKKKDLTQLWGGGFSLYNILDNYNKIDRSDIKAKIKNNFFDLIIYGSIRGENIFYNEVINSKSKVAFIDTSDDPHIDTKKIKKGIYFKRELYENKRNIFPISFAIPGQKIIKEINLKPQNVLSPLIPGKKKTYIYSDEINYYKMYENSLFSITTRKTGWDCLRHYEILASGSLPFFLDIKYCPKFVCTTLPKDKLEKILNKFQWILNFYNPFATLKKRNRNFENLINYFMNIFKKKVSVEQLIFKHPELNELRYDLLSYTKKFLTCEKLAEYVVNKLIKN